jgi:hypothetical protein
MKRCPICNSTFDDEELSYCTTDGTVLVRDEISANLESQATAIFGEPPPTVLLPPRPTEDVPVAPAHVPSQPQPYGWANEAPPVWVPPAPPPVRFTGTGNQQQTAAVVSLIFGLVGITLGWICGGPLFGLLAVILGVVALVQIKNNPSQYGGKPMALIGLISGGFVLLVNAAIFAFWIVMLVIGAAGN